MVISKKQLFIFAIIAMTLSCFFVFKVSAQNESITSEQTELIRSSCSSVKNTLNQLHASDALLRVNRGQLYEAIETKLMSGFNDRVLNNHYNNSDLVTITNNYGSMLDTFRADYITYEEQLSAAIDIDCSKQPVAFYDAVADSRTKRQQVHADVAALNSFIDQYQLAVDKFESSYQQATLTSGTN